MDKKLKQKLIAIAKEHVKTDDPSHDFGHALRVLAFAENIAKKEEADLDVIVPAALFHDIINHPKNSPKANIAPDESADLTRKILKQIKEYPQRKISDVHFAIKNCSFNKAAKVDPLEAQILQDADGLEATGAISIMRTFSSTGSMQRPFYNPKDPFCKKRQPDSLHYALDLFFTRLLVVEKRMNTKTAKKIAKKRTVFLRIFLEELRSELKGA